MTLRIQLVRKQSVHLNSGVHTSGHRDGAVFTAKEMNARGQFELTHFAGSPLRGDRRFLPARACKALG